MGQGGMRPPVAVVLGGGAATQGQSNKAVGATERRPRAAGLARGACLSVVPPPPPPNRGTAKRLHELGWGGGDGRERGVATAARRQQPRPAAKGVVAMTEGEEERESGGASAPRTPRRCTAVAVASTAVNQGRRG